MDGEIVICIGCSNVYFQGPKIKTKCPVCGETDALPVRMYGGRNITT